MNTMNHQSTSNQTPNINPKAKKRLISNKVSVILIIVLAFTSFYFFRQSLAYKKNPNAISEREVKDLVEKVGELIVLPENEVPTVATVSDPEALKNQSFFSEANKGDKVLIYTDAGKAILYDPVLNKIISVAPLTISDSPSGSISTEEI